jgi:hypothetical protein
MRERNAISMSLSRRRFKKTKNVIIEAIVMKKLTFRTRFGSNLGNINLQ